MNDHYKPISQPMADAMAFANKNGGKLYRHPGGFWSTEHFDINAPEAVWFSSVTVAGLVNRKLMDYCKWEQGKRRPFPVEARLV